MALVVTTRELTINKSRDSLKVLCHRTADGDGVFRIP